MLEFKAKGSREALRGNAPAQEIVLREDKIASLNKDKYPPVYHHDQTCISLLNLIAVHHEAYNDIFWPCLNNLHSGMSVHVTYDPECDQNFRRLYHNQFQQWMNANHRFTIHDGTIINFD